MIREVCYKITENCPCNCTFCDSKEKYDKILKGQTMNFEDWKNISDKLIDNGLEVVVLSGGEPLLRKDVTINLIRYLKERGIYVVLNTSGILFNDKRILEDVVNNYPNLLVFSVDSSFETQHDNNRRMRGVFKSVIDSIDALRKIGEYPIGIRTVITKQNYEQLPEIIEKFNKLKIACVKLTNIENDQEGIFRLTLDNLNDFNENIRPKIVNVLKKCYFDNKELREQSIIKINKLFSKENGILYSELDKGHFSPNLIGNVKCDLDGHFLTIQANGDVLPCCEAEHHYYPNLGNLRKMNVKEIINSEIFNEFMNKRLDYCITCTQHHNLQIDFKDNTKVVNRR